MPTRLRVRDVMTPEPSAVRSDAPLRLAAEEIIEKRYSGVPVEDEEGDLVGLVEVDDLLPRPGQVPFTRVPVLEFHGEWVDENELEAFSRALQEIRVDRVMRTDLPTIAPDAPLGEALSRLVTQKARRLLVIDEAGELIGVVTRTDVLRVLSGGP